MVQGWGGRAPGGTEVKEGGRAPGGTGVGGGRAPGGTGCGWVSSRWYRGEEVKRGSRAPRESLLAG